MAKLLAKLDKTRQNTALSVKQSSAIDFLLLGKTDQEMADAVGVSKQTIYE